MSMQQEVLPVTPVRDANLMTVQDDDKRYPVLDPATGEPIVDISFEEKMEIAAKAAQRRAENYETDMRYTIRRALDERNVQESITYLQDLNPADRVIGLQVERENKNRATIFKELGEPEEDK